MNKIYNKLFCLILFIVLTNISVVYAKSSLNKNRAVAVKAKTQIKCPEKNESLGVLYIAGQSNAGNHGEFLVEEGSVKDVTNFYNGKCYKASSPMLGGSNYRGEFNSLIAQKLVDNGLYSHVLVANTSIGSSKIDRWKADGDIGKLLYIELNSLLKRYDIDMFIWIHGESDNRANTPVSEYVDDFIKMISVFPELSSSNVGLTLNTHCKDWALKKNNLVKANAKLVNTFGFKNLGNLNSLGNDYRKDQCHFNKQGQFLAADIIFSRLNSILKKDSLQSQ